MDGRVWRWHSDGFRVAAVGLAWQIGLGGHSHPDLAWHLLQLVSPDLRTPTKMEGRWNAMEACDGGVRYVRAACWPERRSELLTAPRSPFPLIFLAGLLLADRTEGEKGKSGCGWSFSRFLSCPVARRYRGLCACDSLISLLCSACPSLPPPSTHRIDYHISSIPLCTSRIAHLPVPDQPGTSLAHLVRRVAVPGTASTVRLWLFCICCFSCVLSCTVLYCSGLYHCIVISHCTYAAYPLLRAFCILPGLHRRLPLASPSPRQ